MTITLQAVNELIASLESAGELSIREQKYLELAKEFRICSTSLDAVIRTGNALADQNAQLAAENAALKTFCKNAAFDADYEAELGMERGGFTDALNDIETPATDRIVAGIKADGVEEFIGRLQQHVDEGDFVGDEVAVIVGAIDCGKEFSQQLREGADK
ncbi:hypothetical protein [Klebsiella sp. C283]|uniref:hypothetical protein n=1 Tax=Klebsiella sp. C283 TaxID=3409937 RepID=UPI0039B81386|nr:hypothetical protein [Klebsiella quasipneumoniae]HBT6129246.1 hypothetical protein [Klebsiella quasipneumoniae]HBT6223079.1 hypothetical protein [Klebsiella quasipneumoniae]HBT6245805.1 hypothetical protein [Klebsiella quasipneumoniae]HDG7908528.1 hypothetical protein [Klebsiella quasipneumoniae]